MSPPAPEGRSSIMPKIEQKAEIIRDVLNAISAGSIEEAKSRLKKEYPFQKTENAGRKYTEYQSLKVFLRDSFSDRYSGTRLLNPAALRLLSELLPDEFPAHPNWKQSETHIGFWELFPTIDHIFPVARGGADEEENWVTTSMLRNSAKGNALLDEIGWSLLEPEVSESWDGMTKWIVTFWNDPVNSASIDRMERKSKAYIHKWVKASMKALAWHEQFTQRC